MSCCDLNNDQTQYLCDKLDGINIVVQGKGTQMLLFADSWKNT